MNVAVVVIMPQSCVSITVRFWESQDAGVLSKGPPAFYGRPVTSNQGLSGAYLLTSSAPGAPEWVFKPRSQEAQQDGQSLKAGVARGSCCINDVAAYLLDYEGFAGVPETKAMVVDVNLGKSRLVEFGSLQRYIQHEGSCEDHGSSLFGVDNIHRIGLFDLRIGNCDRHEGNVLAVRERDTLRAVPIDHGYCLPSWRDLRDLYFCWGSWRQSSLPFSSETKFYIANLTPLFDVADLLRIGVGHDSAMTYVLCTFFVQRAVAEGLTLAEIASLMHRPFDYEGGDEEESQLELLVNDAAAKSGFEDFQLASLLDWKLPIVRSFLKHFIMSSSLFLANYQLN
jgi:hypothetical protein